MSDLAEEDRGRSDILVKAVQVRLFSEEKYTFKAAAMAVGVSEQSLRAWYAKFARPRRLAVRTPPSKSCATKSSACESNSSGRSWSVKSYLWIGQLLVVTI